jgi:hypothetical protein
MKPIFLAAILLALPSAGFGQMTLPHYRLRTRSCTLAFEMFGSQRRTGP